MSTPSERKRFKPCTMFFPTAFHRRYELLVLDACEDRLSHVISALPGSGKTWSARELIMNSGATKHPDGRSYMPIVGTCSPASKSTEEALIAALLDNFGVIPSMSASERRLWPVKLMARMGTKVILIDDAHCLSLTQLMYLKEVVDRLRFPPYCHTAGICLVAASFGVENALVAHLSRPEMLWFQFQTRLDGPLPFCTVDGHTQGEVHDILGQFETYFRMNQFPQVRLSRWYKPVYAYLTDSAFDPAGTKRITMDNVTKLVNLTLATAYAQQLPDVTAELLQASAERLKEKKNVVLTGDPSQPPQGSVDLDKQDTVTLSPENPLSSPDQDSQHS